MPTVFISYRREDASGHAGRLCDHLNARLGVDRVFMDVEDVRPGQDFVRAIDDTVARCDCLLVVIGPRWLDAVARRAAGEDFVRHEIAAGLRRGITIVPVLVAGATMPTATDLPSDLAELSRRNAVRIRDDRFDDDVEELVGFLGGDARRRRGRAGALRWRWTGAAAALAAIVLAGWWYISGASAPPLTGEWAAQMRKPGQQPYEIRLTLTQAGNRVGGMVRYPTGDAVIEDGLVDGETIAFSTSHVPQFAAEVAVIDYTGTVERDAIQLTSTDAAGIATGIARRAGEP